MCLSMGLASLKSLQYNLQRWVLKWLRVGFVCREHGWLRRMPPRPEQCKNYSEEKR